MGLVAVADLVTKEHPLDNERRTLQIKLSLMDHLCVCVGGIGIQLMCGLGVILFFIAVVACQSEFKFGSYCGRV